MVLYVASDVRLSELPEDTPPPPLSMRPARDDEEGVRAHFTKPHVYFLGSHTGCGCGFAYGEGVEDDVEGRASVRRLGEYLADALERAGPLELYACWDGDEGEPEAARAVISPAEFTGDAEEFDLPERWFASVRGPAR